MEQDKFNQVPQVQWTVQDVVFREAQEPELDFVVKYNIGVAVETEDKTCDWDEVKKTTHRIMQNPELGTYFVSYLKGHEHFPIAANMISYEYNILNNRDCCWFQSVYVQAEFRGQGIFKNIYNQTRDMARGRGYNKVKLYVETDNEPAIATYKKLGMTALENSVVYEIDSVFAFGNTVASHTARAENVAKNVAMIDEISSYETLKTTLDQKLGFSGLELVEIRDMTVDQLEKLNFDGLQCLNEPESDPEANLKNYRGGCLKYIKENLHLGGFCFLRNPEKPSEVLALFTNFYEYSDWRSGNMVWVYDIRVQAQLLQDWPTVDLIINFYLRNFLARLGSDSEDLRVLRVVVDKSKTELIGSLEK